MESKTGRRRKTRKTPQKTRKNPQKPAHPAPTNSALRPGFQPYLLLLRVRTGPNTEVLTTAVFLGGNFAITMTLDMYKVLPGSLMTNDQASSDQHESKTASNAFIRAAAGICCYGFAPIRTQKSWSLRVFWVVISSPSKLWARLQYSLTHS